MDEVRMGFNKYCGPAALSILTGRNTDECAQAISSVNGTYKITGVTISDLTAAGDKLGLRFKYYPAAQGRSLFFIASMILSKEDGMYLVLIPKHYVVVEVKDGVIQLCDNHTKTPINLQNSARLHQKVEQLYKVSIKPYIPPPTVVETTYGASYLSDTLTIKQFDKMSDESIKTHLLGNLKVKGDRLQDIAFAIMDIARKVDQLDLPEGD